MIVVIHQKTLSLSVSKMLVHCNFLIDQGTWKLLMVYLWIWIVLLGSRKWILTVPTKQGNCIVIHVLQNTSKAEIKRRWSDVMLINGLCWRCSLCGVDRRDHRWSGHWRACSWNLLWRSRGRRRISEGWKVLGWLSSFWGLVSSLLTWFVCECC